MRVYLLPLVFAVLGLFFSNCSGDIKDIPLKGCSKISGMPGPEDLAIDREAGLLYVSSHERRIKDQEGKLYFLDLNSSALEPKLLETDYPKNFRPHGMSLLNQNGKSRLYVISHITLYKEHAIEVFERTEKPSAKSKAGKWKHVQTLQDPSITSPNDLSVASENEIFVSNDHGEGGYFTYLFQDLFRIARAEIAYFDGKTWSSLGNPLFYGNGILYVKRPDGKEYLYRAGFGLGAVLKFDIKRENGKIVLGEPKSIVLESGPDNLEIDEKGTIFTVTHPSVIKFLKHAGNPEAHSPTKIFTIAQDDSIREIFSNSGELISAGSTALTYKERVYIAQVFNDFILQCRL
ncbi:arylesterase [Leptospira dzoumogneensis]|uniref:Arylesterase n=1 Tax=Leptospira dzoumogneensis TaxID=2484904 RepID=A0A4Z1AXG7_9LEPT|nr:arylesterase [Leptospira dzoumogneensis]TGN02830.1 arylesterase [Leptospira dzoumogneensis]